MIHLREDRDANIFFGSVWPSQFIKQLSGEGGEDGVDIFGKRQKCYKNQHNIARSCPVVVVI